MNVRAYQVAYEQRTNRRTNQRMDFLNKLSVKGHTKIEVTSLTVWNSFVDEYWRMIDRTIETWNKPLPPNPKNFSEFVQTAKEIFSR